MLTTMSTKHAITLRFSIRTALAVTALLALLLWLVQSYAASWWNERRQIAALRQVGSVITEPRGQYLYRQFAGDALAQRAVYVHLHGLHVSDETLRELSTLKYVEVLSINGGRITDAGLQCLSKLPNLRMLTLVDTGVTAAGVEKLRGALPPLRLISRRDYRRH
jgi:hypothetical protein